MMLSSQQPGSDSLALPLPTDTIHPTKPFLRRGQLSGNARVFWMNTNNRSGLQDYYALASGVGISYHTGRIARHLELGASGFFSINVLSSDLLAPDPRTGRGSRYEVGLFNLLNLGSHQVLSRPEQLYARYYMGQSSQVTVGRQLPASPFVNPEDGRMTPTLTEGLVLDWQEWKHFRLRAEYLVGVSPRSTVKWFGVGESMGILPGGVNTAGKPSQYVGNLSANKLLMLGLTRQKGPLTVQFWETYVPTIFHTAFLQTDWVQPLSRSRQWRLGGQLTRQWALGAGGNGNPALTYIDPGARSLVVSAQAGYQTSRWTVQVNATRITAEGRFLMPRDWGREPFYTFMLRERNEGLGDVRAVTASAQYKWGAHWRWELTTGYYKVPDVTNVRLNKYALPSYSQVNLRARYHGTGFLAGFDADVLLVQKANQTGQPVSDRIAQNRVSMSQANLVLNYHF